MDDEFTGPQPSELDDRARELYEATRARAYSPSKIPVWDEARGDTKRAWLAAAYKELS